MVLYVVSTPSKSRFNRNSFSHLSTQNTHTLYIWCTEIQFRPNVQRVGCGVVCPRMEQFFNATKKEQLTHKNVPQNVCFYALGICKIREGFFKKETNLETQSKKKKKTEHSTKWWWCHSRIVTQSICATWPQHATTVAAYHRRATNIGECSPFSDRASRVFAFASVCCIKI